MSEINQLLTMYLEYKIINLLCVAVIVSFSQNICLREKLCYSILICYKWLLNKWQNNILISILNKYFNDKHGRISKSWVYRLRKIGETRNYLLEEIKHNDLMN